MSALGYFVFFLLCYLGFLAAGLPAGVVVDHLRDSLPAGVRVAGLSGTWLAGRAGEVVMPGVAPFGLRWRLHPMALLSGRVAARVRTSGAVAVAGEVAGWRGGFSVRHLSGRVAAGRISSPLPLAGDFICTDVAARVVDGRLVRASGVVVWRHAGVGSWSGLGDVRAAIGSDDGALVARLTGEDGLDLAAELRLAPGGALRLRGTARPSGAGQETLFALMGPSGPDGRVRIDYNGRVSF